MNLILNLIVLNEFLWPLCQGLTHRPKLGAFLETLRFVRQMRIKKNLFFGATFFLLNLAFDPMAQADNFIASVHEYMLPNGLTLLVRVDRRAPVVMSQVWYQGGSSQERLGQTGVSHFLEHMMYQGTETFPPGELTQLIITNGGEINASTYRDATMYSDFMPKDQLPLIFQLESDRMQNLNFTANQFEKEKNIILDEQRLNIDDQPMGYMFQTLNYVAGMDAPYNNPIIGWMGDIQQLSSQELMNWYHEYYAPNLATVVIVGDVDPDSVYQLAQQYFGDLKEAMPLSIKSYPLLNQTGVTHILIKRPGGVPTLLMSFRVPSIASSQVQQVGFDLDVLRDLLGEMDSSRLQEHVVRGQSLASYIAVYYNPMTRYNTTFTILARPMPNVSLSQLEGAIFDEITRLEQNPPSDDELARVKKYAQSQHLYNLDSLDGQANLLGRLNSIGLPWQLSSDYLLALDSVTRDDLVSTLQLYFNQDNLVDAELMPVGDFSDQAPPMISPALSSSRKVALMNNSEIGEVLL